MKAIKEILMERDGTSARVAEEIIEEAREALQEYLTAGDFDAAENICEEFFGLEPDYLDQLY